MFVFILDEFLYLCLTSLKDAIAISNSVPSPFSSNDAIAILNSVVCVLLL